MKRGRKSGRKDMFPWTRREMMENLDHDPESVKNVAFQYETSTQNVLRIQKKWRLYKKLGAYFDDLVTRMGRLKVPKEPL